MKIVAYEASRMTVLFPLEEVTPLGGPTSDKIVDKVAERYEFTKLPNLNVTNDEIDKSGIRFERGILKKAGSNINIIEFVVFNDGVVIGSQTTEDAELFWSDIFAWLRTEHGYREFATPPLLRYISQIIVEFDSPLINFMKDFEKLSSPVSKVLSAIYDAEIRMDFSRIDLEFDRIGNKSALNIPRFIIERRVQIPFERERYMCSAPMRTRDHISVLEEIERSLP
jgi:hypothetical protein